jgi:hypothetical protein
MKRVLFRGLFLSIFLAACHDGKNPDRGAGGDTVARAKPDTPRQALTIDTTRREGDTTRREAPGHGLKDKLIGIWAFTGDENPSFVIDQKKITYPDQDKKYSYVLQGDSIHIKYDGYYGNYLVKTRGADTLVLKGDEEQVYYRFKQ